jgi:putative SOS response-associated peptidase YedK
MCYDIKASLESQLQRALMRGDADLANQIKEELVPQTDLPVHHASGFSHPKLLIYTDADPNYPTIATWGLVPFWVKTEDQRQKIRNQTLNARSETLFEKPAFRDSAFHHRGLLYVDGFYEHQHHGRKTYPYFIHRKDGKPLILACLYSLWDNPVNHSQEVSFSIVTTGANELMTQIHNNPRAEGPRMPLILTESECDLWLKPSNSRLREELTVLMRPYPEEELTAHTVARLRGKEALGNVPEVAYPYFYSDLAAGQGQNTLDFEGF